MVVLSAGTVEDTTSIGHEAGLSLNVDCDGAARDGSLGVGDAGDTGNLGSSGKTTFARAVSASVGVGRTGVGTVALEPLEGLGGPATVAALVAN